MADWIIETTCKDRSYGARPLRRAIQRYVEDPLSEELIRGHLRGGEIEVYLDAGVLAYRPPGRPRPAAAGLRRLTSCKLKGWDGSRRRQRRRAACRAGLRQSCHSVFWHLALAHRLCRLLRPGAQDGAAPAPRPPRQPAPAAGSGRQQPPPAAPQSHRRRRQPPAGGGRRRRLQPAQAPAKLPPAGVAAAGPLHPAEFPAQGGRFGHRAQTYLYYIQTQVEPAVGRRVGGLRREDEETLLEDFKRLWATNFLDDLSIEVDGRPVRQRRDRQAHHLQARGAPARQDRRLRGQQEARADEDRREAQGREHHDPARLVHRSRADPQGRGRRARPAVGEGPSVRRGDAPRSSRCPAGRSWCTCRSTIKRRPEGQDPRHRLRREQGRERRRARSR